MARESEEGWREKLVQGLGRPLLLIFWCLVLWGTLYGALLLNALVAEGPTTVLQRALSNRDRVAGVANLALAAIAPAVWLMVGIAIWRSRRKSVAQRRARPDKG